MLVAERRGLLLDLRHQSTRHAAVREVEFRRRDDFREVVDRDDLLEVALDALSDFQLL